MKTPSLYQEKWFSNSFQGTGQSKKPPPPYLKYSFLWRVQEFHLQAFKWLNKKVMIKIFLQTRTESREFVKEAESLWCNRDCNVIGCQLKTDFRPVLYVSEADISDTVCFIFSHFFQFSHKKFWKRFFVKFTHQWIWVFLLSWTKTFLIKWSTYYIEGVCYWITFHWAGTLLIKCIICHDILKTQVTINITKYMVFLKSFKIKQ